MTKKRFQELKNLLRESPSPEPIRQFFLDHFYRSGNFKRGTETRDEFLEAMLQMAVWQMNIEPVEPTGLTMRRIADRLTCGEFTAGPHRGTFFFYDKAGAGVVWLQNSTACQRFRLRVISEAEARLRLGHAV